MKLKEVIIKNFRSFGATAVSISFDDLTTFIGSNSTGKTTAIEALGILFSDNKANRILEKKDFHISPEMDLNELEGIQMFIEVIFEVDTVNDTNNDEYNIACFSHYLTASQDGGNPYLRVRLEASWFPNTTLDGSIEYNTYYITVPKGEEENERDKIQANRRELDLIRLIYVPAMRNTESQLKNISGSLMYRLLNSVQLSNDSILNIEGEIETLNSEILNIPGIKLIATSLNRQWKEYSNHRNYTDAKLQFTSTDLNTALKATSVIFNSDRFKNDYKVNEIGDGLRSLFYISMVASILEVEGNILKDIARKQGDCTHSILPPFLTIVAIEEPENHIAPHLLGRLIKNLETISSGLNSQVIMTSHSASIIKRINPQNIRYFRMDNATSSTLAKPLLLPAVGSEQFKYIKEAVKAYPEIYFAKLVILGEGDSEELLLSRLWEIEYEYIDAGEVSVVPLGGRFVHHFWKLLNDLKIPYITLLDLDKERKDGGWKRIAYAVKQLELFNETFYEDNLLNLGLETEVYQGYKAGDEYDKESQSKFLEFLERYNIFFSNPLDLDFLMLKAFEENYKALVGAANGPIIKVNNKREFVSDYEKQGRYDTDEYSNRVEKAVSVTLKGDSGDGNTYSVEEKRLMIWYSYLFLGRGKPTTHIQFLSEINDEILIDRLPSVLKRLLGKANTLLGGNNEDN